MDIKLIEAKLNGASHILAAIISEETQEDVSNLKALIAEAVKVVIDIAREPLEAAGCTLNIDRGLSEFGVREKFEKRYDKLNSIIPYSER